MAVVIIDGGRSPLIDADSPILAIVILDGGSSTLIDILSESAIAFVGPFVG